MACIAPGISSCWVGGPSYSARSGGVLSGTGCMVPQPFVIGVNMSYLECWAVIGDPRYPGYFTPTTGMSFALTNTPAYAYFMYLMNKVFMEYLDKFIVVFIDDILIFLKTEEEHKTHLILVLGKLMAHQLCAKFSKCEYWLTKVAFLGLVISVGGVSVHPSKVKDILDWMPPTNVSEIRSFL
jgi:hypothetical protein